MEMTYCYSCRTHHETKLMTLHQTKQGFRWRCKTSIKAAMTPTQIRDRFGRQQTELNKDIARQAAEFVAQIRLPTIAA